MKKSGVLLHISSLPGEYGIGTLGAEAHKFVDFLQAAGQSFWQVLPVCPTGYGDSPYQSFSCEAGNPYFIDLPRLAGQGLLEENEYADICWGRDPSRVDYGILYRERNGILKRAARRFLEHPTAEYHTFLKENAFWIHDYAIFMVLKEQNGGSPWYQWDTPLKDREQTALDTFCKTNAEEIRVWQAIQYFFFCQWYELKNYANQRGISIIGDLPIYVSLDSASVWANRPLFQLDSDGMPTEVAGCPPDGFSAEGQLWGNPLYDWDYMKRDGYAWWVGRIDYLCSLFDILRIDHFRGFESYYAIPCGESSARRGIWRPGPGIDLFRSLRDSVGEKNIIAENLGYLTPAVEDLLSQSGYPGMRLLQFCFDTRDADGGSCLPDSFEEHCVAYIGTHDNDTALGWLTSARPEDAARAKETMQLTGAESAAWGMLRTLWSTKAETTIAQAQDLLELGSEARMNTPSTQCGNWVWRALPGSFTPALAAKLRDLTRTYHRLNKNETPAPPRGH